MPTIALVDDDRKTLSGVSSTLEAEGYRTMTFTDGDSALDNFATTPPDVVILDINITGIDGAEILRSLREELKIPVVILTSGSITDANDSIVKPPPQPHLLVQRVRDILRRSGFKSESAAEDASNIAAIMPSVSSLSPVTNETVRPTGIVGKGHMKKLDSYLAHAIASSELHFRANDTEAVGQEDTSPSELRFPVLLRVDPAKFDPGKIDGFEVNSRLGDIVGGNASLDSLERLEADPAVLSSRGEPRGNA
jgi:CheY-like chemotaxis protein